MHTHIWSEDVAQLGLEKNVCPAPDGGFLYKLLFSRGVPISPRGILILWAQEPGYFEVEYHVMTWLLGAQ